MKPILLLMCVCLPAAFAEEKATPKTIAPDAAAMQRYQQKMAQLKAALQAQIAVFDATENAFRRATAEEATALQPPIEGMGVERPLEGGGFALPADISQLQFLTVQRLASGSVVYTHQPASRFGSTATAGKGGADVR